jgi:hypothetical protein
MIFGQAVAELPGPMRLKRFGKYSDIHVCRETAGGEFRQMASDLTHLVPGIFYDERNFHGISIACSFTRVGTRRAIDYSLKAVLRINYNLQRNPHE